MKQKVAFVFLIIAMCSGSKAQWTIDYRFNGYLTYISVVDSNIVWAVGVDNDLNNTVLRRSPAGIWEVIPTNGISAAPTLTCIAGRDFETAFVTDGGSYGNNGAHIYRTTNGGINWIVQVNTGGYFGNFNAIQFSRTNPQFGYAWSNPPDSNGTPVKIYKTSDGGSTWQTISITVDPRFIGTQNSICVTDSTHAWFGLFNSTGMYDYQRILLTTNGGINFLTSSLPFLGYTVPAIEFKQDNIHGLSATYDQPDYYCKSQNGGITWQYFGYTDIGETIKLINIPNSLTWYAATELSQENKRIFKSTDDGNFWYPMIFPDSIFVRLNYMDGVSYNDRVFLYAVDMHGKIFKLIDNATIIGIQLISSELPKSYSLSQNYPNPFNPTTKIKFSVPSVSPVQIVVYDITGRQVAELVNQQIRPGTYEAQWNASAYSSGIYFCRMIAGDFRSVQKMVLVK